MITGKSSGFSTLLLSLFSTFFSEQRLSHMPSTLPLTSLIPPAFLCLRVKGCSDKDKKERRLAKPISSL